MEASGTGNMKLALNGALTIGTLDGANVEIREAVGADNFFLFGMNAQQVQDTYHNGYNPRTIYETSPELKAVIDMIGSGHFCPEQKGLFQPIVDALIKHDTFRVLGDFGNYVNTHREVDAMYLDQKRWGKAAITNIAKMGRFSSDRAIEEYATHIWNIKPVTLHQK